MNSPCECIMFACRRRYCSEHADRSCLQRFDNAKTFPLGRARLQRRLQPSRVKASDESYDVKDDTNLAHFVTRNRHLAHSQHYSCDNHYRSTEAGDTFTCLAQQHRRQLLSKTPLAYCNIHTTGSTLQTHPCSRSHHLLYREEPSFVPLEAVSTGWCHTHNFPRLCTSRVLMFARRRSRRPKTSPT